MGQLICQFVDISSSGLQSKATLSNFTGLVGCWFILLYDKRLGNKNPGKIVVEWLKFQSNPLLLRPLTHQFRARWPSNKAIYSRR